MIHTPSKKTPSGLKQKSTEQLGAGLSGVLLCWVCQKREVITEERAGEYLRRGWPECCGETMELKTRERL